MSLRLYPPREKHPSWYVRGTYLGIVVERSAKTDKRPLAQKVLKQIEREIESGIFSSPREQTFGAAAVAYLESSDGAMRQRSLLTRVLERIGDKPISAVDQSTIDAVATVLHPQATAATRNRQVYTPICAVLRHAGATIHLRRPKGSAGKQQTGWLWPEQAQALFKEATALDARFGALLVVLCYTGLRLGEALGLVWNDVRLSEGFAYVPDTKTGQPRGVYLPAMAVAAVGNLEGDKGGRVFGFAKGGHLYSLLHAAANRAGVELPERSAFHLFRHTYATWMRRYAGLDTRGLIGTGAWKDQKSAARYAHVVVSEEARRADMLPGAGRESA
jgi:integrase